MKSHELARLLLSLPDADVVHPGQAGDIGIERAYRCKDYGVIVVADRDEDYRHTGSEEGRRVKGPQLPAHPDDLEDAGILEARRYVEAHRADGVDCPCCCQFVKEYRRKLNSSMARGLIWLVREARSGDRWVDVRSDAPAWLLAMGGTFAKLKLWTLIEERPNEDTRKTHSGEWRATDIGDRFARGEVKVPGYAVVYDGRSLGIEGEETSIEEALGNHFDYAELWRVVQ